MSGKMKTADCASYDMLHLGICCVTYSASSPEAMHRRNVLNLEQCRVPQNL